MFDVAYEVGADLSLKNGKCLTPLTLAATLARVEMFFHIMNIEREIYWQIGESLYLYLFFSLKIRRKWQIPAVFGFDSRFLFRRTQMTAYFLQHFQ